MKIKIILFAASLLTLILAACSKDEPNEDAAIAAAGRPAVAAPTAVAPPIQVIPPPNRQVQPGQADVKAAFLYSLTRTAETVPPGAQRDAWFRTEAAKIQAISATACSAASIGQPSACSLVFDGRRLEGVKILLTNAGWVVLP